ncbi:hypothetical protein BCR34DRAFT_595640 [Clohesyomyces aquaticus]|uniref:Uncharacterized protein n=1 Tax=Clohesyomyces aquaticus TaxID=1231657 RepID=A0A1Y2A9S7_9PLEO|nr:hypothetical protein BCR34DRAFT_595640 [Clohesyomyces aquaticus]
MKLFLALPALLTFLSTVQAEDGWRCLESSGSIAYDPTNPDNNITELDVMAQLMNFNGHSDLTSDAYILCDSRWGYAKQAGHGKAPDLWLIPCLGGYWNWAIDRTGETSWFVDEWGTEYQWNHEQLRTTKCHANCWGPGCIDGGVGKCRWHHWRDNSCRQEDKYNGGKYVEGTFMRGFKGWVWKEKSYERPLPLPVQSQTPVHPNNKPVVLTWYKKGGNPPPESVNGWGGRIDKRSSQDTGASDGEAYGDELVNERGNPTPVSG